MPAPFLVVAALLGASSAIGSERIAAKLYGGKGQGPRPAVMILGGSEGGMVGRRRPLVRKLRAAGYDVVGLATFKHPGLPRTGARVPLDAFARRAAALRAMHGCVAFVGISRGGEAALLLAARAPRAFDATVAVVPAHVAGPAPGPSLVNRPAWSWRGRDVPYVPTKAVSRHGLRWLFASGAERAAANHAIKLDSLRSQPQAVKRARIAVERIERPLLVLSATQDHVWPSAMMGGEIENAVWEAGRGDLLEHVRIDGNHFLADDRRGVAAILRFLRRHLTGRDCNAG